MRFLIVVPDCKPGGVTSSSINLSNELIKRGHEVTYLNMDDSPTMLSRLNQKVEFLYIEGFQRYWNITADKSKGLNWFSHKSLGIFKKVLIRLGLWYKLIFKRQKRKKYDVAIAFKQCEPCYYYVLKKITADKKICFIHGELKYMGAIDSWAKYMKKFNKVSFVSSTIKKEFEDKFPFLNNNNSCVIYNMFDIDVILTLAKKECSIKYDKDVFNITTISRIDEEFKQLSWIVDVCSIIKHTSNLSFHWYIIGDGPDFDYIKHLSCEKNVDDVLSMVGFFDNPYPLLAQTNLSVLSSKSEAYPMFIGESFILEKPVVSTRFSSAEEVIKNKYNGIIADQNIESLASCVLKMASNDKNIFNECKTYLNNYKFNNDLSYKQLMEAIYE